MLRLSADAESARLFLSPGYFTSSDRADEPGRNDAMIHNIQSLLKYDNMVRQRKGYIETGCSREYFFFSKFIPPKAKDNDQHTT